MGFLASLDFVTRRFVGIGLLLRTIYAPSMTAKPKSGWLPCPICDCQAHRMGGAQRNPSNHAMLTRGHDIRLSLGSRRCSCLRRAQTCRNLLQGTQPPDLISLRAVANQTTVLSRGPPAEPSGGRSRDMPRTLNQTCAAKSALHRQRRTGGRRAITVRPTERGANRQTT
jgi:hypothetical protein